MDKSAELSPERAEEELEDLRDIEDIKKSGGDWIGLDQLAKDLGLV